MSCPGCRTIAKTDGLREVARQGGGEGMSRSKSTETRSGLTKFLALRFPLTPNRLDAPPRPFLWGWRGCLRIGMPAVGPREHFGTDQPLLLV